ncbi:histidine phosphatase family protein [Azohydromonas sp. G-1-1-14]|uniref:Histidine phosphatase family protein n=1 Tax=Azohydromonas caseinilytica TaxID=2728836 RepID=A0A848FD30_9BURK|nr:histidine phosphatase family protein [Azohydromonas caseinilytica]NML16193.1 histidine phosphatase family protein [Azohydromonas caseinilytica]
MPLEATRIIAIRHGETDWNADTRIQGHTDIPLNAHGRWQAQCLTQALADEPLQAVYASDLGRAVETAAAFAQAAGLPVQREPGLRERRFGCFEGLRFDEIEQRWPEDSLRWRRRDPDFGPEGGETLRAFYDRCVTAAAQLAARHPGQSIALVSHGGVLDCLYRAATRLDLQAPRTWQVGNAAVNRLLHTPQGFMLVGWSDDMHLARPALDEPA